MGALQPMHFLVLLLILAVVVTVIVLVVVILWRLAFPRPSTATVPPTLTELADLRDRGEITDAEFERAKRRALGT